MPVLAISGKIKFMKLHILSLWALLLSSSAFAGDDMAMAEDTAQAQDEVVAEKLIDMELNKDKGIKGDSTVVSIHLADDETDAELEARAKRELEDMAFDKADIIDAVHTEKEDVAKLKVEIGADHDPVNYPKFMASVLTLDFSDPRVPLERIVDGGVVVDEIPTLVNPLLIPIKEAQDYMHYSDNEYMAVIEINGDARAYPLRVLNWHQGVNEVIGGQPVFVSYDPLSGSVFAMDRRVAGEKETTFGVTGQVYNNTSLYYDRATKSVWSAYANKAITGALAGKKMKKYEAVLTTWKSYKETYPQGMVIDMMHTGYERNYRQNPYGDYAKTNKILFPAEITNNAFALKEHVVGIRAYKGGKSMQVAIPVNMLLESKHPVVNLGFSLVHVAGQQQIPLTFKVSKPYGKIEVTSADKDVVLETLTGFWLAWHANNPNTRVITTLK
tara:strand:+ start:51435 stop:52760 length:1326 start_codon:yes stop_codon:yes gene_type:complete